MCIFVVIGCFSRCKQKNFSRHHATITTKTIRLVNNNFFFVFPISHTKRNEENQKKKKGRNKTKQSKKMYRNWEQELKSTTKIPKHVNFGTHHKYKLFSISLVNCFS